jgi:hypothetical protein
VGRLGGIEIEVDRYDIPLSVGVEDMFKDNHLKLTCGIVFDIADIPTSYLRVSPEGVQWITPEEAIRYMVESNTKWKVDIN